MGQIALGGVMWAGDGLLGAADVAQGGVDPVTDAATVADTEGATSVTEAGIAELSGGGASAAEVAAAEEAATSGLIVDGESIDSRIVNDAEHPPAPGTEGVGEAGDAPEAASGDWPVISKIVRNASGSKGNFGLGEGTLSQATRAGESWVGDGYRIASDGKTLVSSDGLRAFRPPSWKPGLGKYQANFEYSLDERVGKPFGNGHLDITDMGP